VIVDARTLLSYFDRTAESHWSVAGEVEFAATFEQLVVSPFVIAELEAMVKERFGAEGWLAVLDELARGAWSIAEVDPEHLRAVQERVEVESGATLAEASVAVLAQGTDS
jgi:predicted nucleic acid-binding protein